MSKDDIKAAILPVCLTVSLIFSFASLQYALSVKQDYNDLKSKSDTMAKTIEDYSAQLDTEKNIKIIKQKDIRIKELEQQLASQPK